MATSNNPNGENYEKIVLKRGEARLKREDLRKAIYVHFYQRKLLSPSTDLFK